MLTALFYGEDIGAHPKKAKKAKKKKLLTKRRNKK